jgi:hypothetical protein
VATALPSGQKVKRLDVRQTNFGQKQNLGTSEGCHFDANTQAPVIKALRLELDNYNLTSVIIAASDENTYDEAYSTWLVF